MKVHLTNISLVVAAALALTAIDVRSNDQEPAEPKKNLPSTGLPMYDSENSLLLPEDYREWVFVGSSLGLSYSESTPTPEAETFKHVYVNPFGYREYRKTGEFPVGSMFMLELATKGTKTNPALRGSFSQEFIGLEAAVKSGDRFDESWTYYSFDGKDGQRLSTARRFTDGGCISCHRQHAETDHVFTQFYPVLKNATAPKK